MCKIIWTESYIPRYMYTHYSTFQDGNRAIGIDTLQYISGWLFERNREQWGIGIRSIDAKITQTTNPIVNMTKTKGLWLMLF